MSDSSLQSKNFEINTLVSMIKNDSTIIDLIHNNDDDSGMPWTKSDIIESVYDALDLELDHNNDMLFSILLPFFNQED